MMHPLDLEMLVRMRSIQFTYSRTDEAQSSPTEHLRTAQRSLRHRRNHEGQANPSQTVLNIPKYPYAYLNTP